jgi:hypothetical protein
MVNRTPTEVIGAFRSAVKISQRSSTRFVGRQRSVSGSDGSDQCNENDQSRNRVRSDFWIDRNVSGGVRCKTSKKKMLFHLILGRVVYVPLLALP